MQVCGQCQKEFKDEAAYLDHVCETTGFKPSNPEHLGPDFAAASEAALKRGEERKGEEKPAAAAAPAKKAK